MTKGLRAVIAERAYDDTVLDVEDAQELQDLLMFSLHRPCRISEAKRNSGRSKTSWEGSKI